MHKSSRIELLNSILHELANAVFAYDQALPNETMKVGCQKTALAPE